MARSYPYKPHNVRQRSKAKSYIFVPRKFRTSHLWRRLSFYFPATAACNGLDAYKNSCKYFKIQKQKSSKNYLNEVREHEYSE